ALGARLLCRRGAQEAGTDAGLGEDRGRTRLSDRVRRSAAGQNEVGPARCVIIMTAPVSELEDEIAHLRDLDLRGLRARWHSVFRRKAPNHLPRHLLYRMIAYRLQAERLGDLDRDTQRFLDQVAAGDPQWRPTPGKGRPPSWPPSRNYPGAGVGRQVPARHGPR